MKKLFMILLFCNIHLSLLSTQIMKLNRGYLFSLEGANGCGKTTVIKILEKLLADNNLLAITTREPGATDLGKNIRAILMNRTAPTNPRAEALLFAADRAQHFDELILPYLAQNYIVISDRMVDSSFVYQSYLKRLDQTTLAAINNFAMQERRPNLVFYLKIDATTSMKRMNHRNQTQATDAFHQEALEKNQQIIDGYDKILENRNDVVIIDATQSCEIVAEQIYQAIVNYIGNL
ncbi:dTMP kinase [Candidatus Babeliales bacterium]|nr:dTMP kinase [Candidatus Babeliales bacterium]MBP9844387.1 dTMP kinase [Candidatus Babeliales bacterium]